ncbi:MULTISPECIES: putative phosphothreonine lyase domain-containing protein [Streptomycetaceae]|uniref:Uncharacterized protein n=1 Tax=Streptantibioticus cattleyicolor (strain ATCC 35852 / DSM 46488 / JCM 4925 / NBRC 14057 / NRRL 8057) TaxID=1003195 RepID=F8JVV9_STREN|nr:MULTISPECIES: putative phosphothreonine lyase domain-containg protein [Streptomycetaceae]AEW98191.1 hypothetical protein SCATT_58200 [Streptantibioticus cattleyicolor NRRL 8057 = DSM 46488]MYS62573.1 DUF1917 domain-containing protein [Streptomyces sp. SID5468]CCB78508.1 conserved protein of unknown function [Streptantibioticus cattleyicolor NRRL 8057 = DSM 46488]
MPSTADGPASGAGLPLPKSLGWTDRVLAPERLDEGLDEFGNRVTGKWMPKGIDQELWERIRGATIDGYLGTQSKVLKDFTRACVYTRDYRDLDDLRRILTVLRELGVHGWIDYKRDCDTARGLYGRGALYWYSPPGTVAIDVPSWSVGREMDRESAAVPAAAVAAGGTDDPRRTGRCPKCGAGHGEGCQGGPLGGVHPERLEAGHISFSDVSGCSQALRRG